MNSELPLKVVSGWPASFGLLEAHEAVAFARDDELGVVDEAHAVLRGEALGAGADEVDVRRLVEHEPRGLDRVRRRSTQATPPARSVLAVHHQRVELHAAVAGEEGAAAGVEGVVVFHDGDGGFDGVEGGAVLREHSPAGGESVGDAALVGCDGVVGHGPGAAVDEKDGLAGAAGRLCSSHLRVYGRPLRNAFERNSCDAL